MGALGAPITVLENVDSAEGITVGPGARWELPEGARAYLLNLLKIKDDKFNKSVTVPSYVADVAKVQIWCAFAEVNLGEANFAQPVTNR